MYKPFVLVGPSGVGKGTLTKSMLEKHQGLFGFSVSYTTRAPREGEVDGVNYHFVSKEEFMAMVDDKEFIEWANVHDKMYGTAKRELVRIQDMKKVPLLEIDTQGAKVVHDQEIDANFVFIKPCGDLADASELLRSRLVGRGTESEEQINTRVANSKAEFDLYESVSFFQNSIVNDDLERATTEFIDLVDNLYGEEIEELE